MGEQIAIVMSAELWSVIDGALDNAGSDAIDEGDEETYEAANTIRQAGADQAPEAGIDDPLVMASDVTIRLELSQWRFVLAELRSSAPIYEEIIATTHPDHRQDYVDSLELGNRAAYVIAATVGETDAGHGR